MFTGLRCKFLLWVSRVIANNILATQFALGLALTVFTFAGVHEIGHWIVYKLASAGPCFKWTYVFATGPLSDGKQLVALHSGLIFQLIPGAAAAVYLLIRNPESKVALGILFGSWFIRSIFVLFTWSLTDSGDEWQIHNLLLPGQVVGSTWVWLISAIPLAMFVLFQHKRNHLLDRNDWLNWGVGGAFFGFGVVIVVETKIGHFDIFGACQNLIT